MRSAAVKSPSVRLTHRQSFCGLPGTSLGLSVGKLKDLVSAVRQGLAFHALERFAGSMSMSVSEVSSLLAIPERTLARRKSAGKLSSEESERLLRLAGVYEKAVVLFEGKSPDAIQWLRLPKKALGGETPLDYAATELGAREVEKLIGRIEQGVFS